LTANSVDSVVELFTSLNQESGAIYTSQDKQLF